jgi:hypothetical protein
VKTEAFQSQTSIVSFILAMVHERNDGDIVDILFPLSLAFRLVVINVAPSNAYWFKILATRL